MEEDKQNIQQVDASEETFDVTGFFLECLSHWKWFVAGVVGLVALTMLYCYCQTPMYEVTSAVYIQENKGEGSNVLLESIGLGSYKKNVDNELEVLRSKNQITDVVDSLNLYTSYAWKPFLRTQPIYGESPIEAVLESLNPRDLKSSLHIEVAPEKGAFHVTALTTTPQGEEVELCNTSVSGLPYTIPFYGGTVRLQYAGDTLPVLDAPLCISISSPRSVSKVLAKKLSVAFASKDATILNITYKTPVVNEGIDFVRALVDFYNIDAAKQKNQGTEKTEEFIESRLASISKELALVEEEVERYRRNKNLIDISEEAKIYLAQTGMTDEMLAELELQKNLVDYVENFLKDPANEYAPVPVLGLNDEGLSKLVGEYNKTLQQRERLLHSSSESNPIMVELTREAQTQRVLVLKGVESVRKGLEIKGRDLARQDREMEDKIKNVPQYERELSDIIRQQRIKDNLYIFLLEKREENSLTQSMTVPVARIIDDPDSTGEPVSPKKMLLLCAAVLFGFLLPALVIYLRMKFFPILKDKKMLERLTSIPILSEISVKPQDKFFVVEKQSVEPIAELFRLLRNNLQFVLTDPDKKVIAVTSSVMHEGKTFVSSNTALSLALTGKRVLIIGTDIRRPRLAEHFHISNQHGLTTYLSGRDTDALSLIRPSGVDANLDVMPAGPVPPNPNELLMSRRFDQLIEIVRGHYDYVILDTAPLGMVSDSFLLTRVTDVVLYVSRANYTNKNSIEMLNSWVRTKRIEAPVYLILNGVNMNSRAYTYRQYGYGGGKYGYGYGSAGGQRLPWYKRLFRKKEEF